MPEGRTCRRLVAEATSDSMFFSDVITTAVIMLLSPPILSLGYLHFVPRGYLHFVRSYLHFVRSYLHFVGTPALFWDFHLALLTYFPPLAVDGRQEIFVQYL